MIVTVLSMFLASIFLLLFLVHLYWFLGGEKGLESAVPAKANSGIVFIPRYAVFLVAVILAIFFLLYIDLVIGDYLGEYKDYKDTLRWLVTVLFILRAIGDFKYVGFFKNIKDTKFGKADTKYFTPLCICIGLAGLYIQLHN